MNISASNAALLAVGFIALSSCGENTPRLTPTKDRITTLYSVDDVLHAWSFSRGEAGKICIDGRIYNRNSQMVYDRFGGQLVAGVEGGAKARVLDIGDLRVRGELNSVYYHLTREGRTVSVKNVAREDGEVEDSLGVRRFDLAPGYPLAKAAVKIGHVYLIRVDEGGVDTNPIFTALRVLDHVPKRYVTFRWRLL